jgi:hypothetical protein
MVTALHDSKGLNMPIALVLPPRLCRNHQLRKAVIERIAA